MIDEWLQQSGIAPEECEKSPAGDWISVSLPVSHVEALLDTEYSIFQHEQGEIAVRATSWSLPRHLHEHIATIQPTTAFLRARQQVSTTMELPEEYSLSDLQQASVSATSNITQACNFSMVTTQCLRSLYGTIDYTPKAGDKNQVGFTNYLGQVTNRSDASIFLQRSRPEAVASAYTYKEVSIAGGPVDNGTSGAGVEADLDVETILGLSYPIKVTSYSTGGSPPFKPDLNTPTNTNEPYLTWLNYVMGQSSLPQTISTSYGDDEQSVPQSYAESVCQGLAQLGARGITLLFSSGDSGVGANGTCFSNDGKNTTEFIPAFPASCPYITTVGGTRAYPEVVAYDPRNGYASGSGFSNYFSRPKYQDNVVKSYIKQLNGTFDGLYNKSGRAYPDIAAQSYRYAIVYNASVIAVDGTSCAAPAMAGVFSLVNDALIAAGKPALGWMNPWLYSKAGKAAFTDVVAGTSIGCDSAGFAATKGWDAASGWGTPNFKSILKVLGL